MSMLTISREKNISLNCKQCATITTRILLLLVELKTLHINYILICKTGRNWFICFQRNY